MDAAISNHFPVQEELLTELTDASASGDLPTVQALCARLLPVSQEEIRRFVPPLAAAVTEDHISVVSYLLSKGVPLNIQLCAFAATNKSFDMLQLFLDYGWDINEPLGRTEPPILGLVFDDESLTKWFLSHGASPNTECGLDCTPLSIAVSRASFHIIRLLFESGGNIHHGQLLQYAVKREGVDRLDVLDFILNKGAPINEIMYQIRPKNYYQLKAFGLGTSLHRAAEMGKLDMVKLLVGKGADPLIKDPRGKLAIERAEQQQHHEVVNFLRPWSALSPVPHSTAQPVVAPGPQLMKV